MSTDERGSAGDDTGLGPDERAVVDRGREWIRNNSAELIDLLTTLLSKPSVTGLEGGHDDPAWSARSPATSPTGSPSASR